MVNKEGKIPVLVEFILQGEEKDNTHKEANRRGWVRIERSAAEQMNGAGKAVTGRGGLSEEGIVS